MYYRRKVALALLQVWGGKLGKLHFQKLLFLLAQTQASPSFDFVPYKFGCYSFQANADLQTMMHYKQVAEMSKPNSARTDTWAKIDPADYQVQLTSADQMALKRLREQFGDYSTDQLIKYTYRKYPFFAINSQISKSILSEEELERVGQARPAKASTGLFSIGYEGKSLEQYMNVLIQSDIRLLCDVRKNSKSMKYGFSKSQLQHACQSVGIDFLHLPNLGIASDKRQSLISQADYDQLFTDYRNTTLKDAQEDVVALADLVSQYQRVAITCFEANIHQCHRKHLAEAVVKLPGWCHQMEHI